MDRMSKGILIEQQMKKLPKIEDPYEYAKNKLFMYAGEMLPVRILENSEDITAVASINKCINDIVYQKVNLLIVFSWFNITISHPIFLGIHRPLSVLTWTLY